MAVFFREKEITSIVFDFDGTLYGEDLQEVIYAKSRLRLTRKLLESKGITSPTEAQLIAKRDEYVTKALEAGWGIAYEQMGGSRAEFRDIVYNTPKAPFLRHDPETTQLIAQLFLHAQTIVFTGSNRTPVEQGLDVLLGQPYRFLINGLLAADNLPPAIQKPDPKAYQKLLKIEYIKPDHAVVVDDNPGEIKTARSLGIIGILVGKSHSKEAKTQADAHIETIHDLLKVLTIND